VEGTYERLSQSRLLIDRARRLLWRTAESVGYGIADRLDAIDPALNEVLEQLDELCGATCPRSN
jgi:hypothetical protein